MAQFIELTFIIETAGNQHESVRRMVNLDHVAIIGQLDNEHACIEWMDGQTAEVEERYNSLRGFCIRRWSGRRRLHELVRREIVL
ncbi:MAG: hypothetical protein J6P46_08535 [Bacteroidales bacterium]|nr:hypothetical protein [Bacteroidales bacterium]